MLHSFSDIITFSRICLTPVIIILCVLPSEMLNYAGWACFLIAALSDAIDGYIARKFGTTSKFGALFDSYADKILIVIMMFLLVLLNRLDAIYATIPAFIITSRELFVFLIRFYSHCKNITLGVSKLAKFKTFFEMISIIILLHPVYHITYHMPGLIILWISAILAVISGFQYLTTLYSIKKDDRILED